MDWFVRWMGIVALATAATLGGCGGDEGPGLGGGDGGTGGVDAGGTVDSGSGGGGDGGCVGSGDPLIDPELLDVCPLCDNARCVPAGFVPPDVREQLADCDDGSKCVPELFIETNGNFLLPSCRSLSDAEGRCVSLCVPAVMDQADLLPVATCADDERCVPCFDPTTGEDTGACGLSCDPGPAEPPVSFDRCCSDLGACVPTDTVPADQRDLLGADTCSDGALCVPDDLADTSYIPPSCRSIADAEGRCLPECLPDVAAQSDLLPQDTCDDMYLCVPCYDPTTGEDTGACTLNGDMPTEDPVTFEECCGGIGSCVPTSSVPADQRDLLGTDTCSEADTLCAPNELTDSSFTPPTCRSIGDVEGRCLPECLPDVAAQSDILPRDSCASTHLCVPCYDPTTGEDTGACTLNGDMPAEDPVVFEDCCGGIGTCVPTSTVPADQRDMLGPDTCSDADALCAPDELTDSSFTPPTCTSLGDAEGRCLPECLPDVAAQADTLPRDTCASTHLCVPCYDPIDGTDTGACTLNGDSPSDPPYTFPGCCTYMGTDRSKCVPESLVPAADRDALPQDTCSTGELCVPEPVLRDPSYSFPSCSTGGLFGGNPGACLPDCMVTGWESWFLTQASCADGEVCAPCTNPITGADTGACR